MAEERFAEFREDGWPICPRCDNDELYSQMIMDYPWQLRDNPSAPQPTLQECLTGEFVCYYCGWRSN